MLAMKNATDAADKLIRRLTRAYNRARQSQITNEIAELMGGVEALK
jgi:F-type H+-transporting ATPase subunit gamma